MNKNVKFKIVGFLLLLIVGGGIFVGFMFNKPHTNVATSSADITVAAKDLFADFENDEVIANGKYLDQIIQVTGPVIKVTTVKDQMIVSIGDKQNFGSVKCHLTLAETQKKYVLKEGQTVTLKGICTGYLMDVILVKAVLVN